MPRKLRILAVSALVLLTTACANLNFYSDAELNALGAQAYVEATKDYPEVTAGPNYQMVQRVGKKIAAASQEGFEWEFKLLKADDVPNAFCLPGGKVAVYSGILPLTQDEDGLAAVVGHEVAHATLRHGGKRMTNATLLQIGLTLGQVGLDMTEMDQDTKNGVMAVLGVGGQLGVLLPYSREHEREADVIGLRYAIRAGYDPGAAPSLWDRMAALSDGTPEWLSTHPASESRADDLRQLIPRLVAENAGWDPTTVNR